MHANLERSGMKSFSLSSLGAGLVPPAPATAPPPERLYHSLHRKRKEAWRRSWGSAGSGGGGAGAGGDDLWPLLQQDYDYIMDNHIIDTCKEASGELCAPIPSRPLAASPPHRKAAALTRRGRTKHSNRQSDGSEGSEDEAAAAAGAGVHFEQDASRFRRWLHGMEGRLPPPSLGAARALSPPRLRAALAAYQVLQREVEREGSAARALGGADGAGGSAAARALERRWHLLYLRTIEWQCHIEHCIDKHQQKACAEVFWESDSEPAHKQPRLSSRSAPRDTDTDYSQLARDGSPVDSEESDASEPELQRLAVTVTALAGDSDMAAAAAEAALGDDAPPCPDVVDGLQYGSEEACSADRSRFQHTEKSGNFATFYFRHHDTDNERAPPHHDTSDEEWSYTRGEVLVSEIQTYADQVEGVVDSRGAVRVDIEEAVEEKGGRKGRDEEKIGRLVAQAETLVQAKCLRPGSANKMSRTAEWLRQHNADSDQCESYDASGEYTTESDAGAGSGGEEPLPPPLDTLLHSNKVVLRARRAGAGAGGVRPWSVACESPAPPRRPPPLSASESALHTLCAPALAASSSSVKTAVQQGHISSTTTIDETCVSCVELGDCGATSARRKRLKLRPAPAPAHPHPPPRRLVKSSSFCGRLSPAAETSERGAASDPATTTHRVVSTWTSGVESSVNVGAVVAERGAAPAECERDKATTTRAPTLAPQFRVGAVCGVRGASLVGARLWELAAHADQDSDLERTTEEHSSFSEQAWDFYQEKYNSEPYSEAPDSEGARRLLEFGDDYRAFLDSQSDNCSSLSAHDLDLAPRRRHNPRQRRSPGAGGGVRKSRSVRSGEAASGAGAGAGAGGALDDTLVAAADVTLHAHAPDSDNEECAEVCASARAQAEAEAAVRASACRLREAGARLARADSAPDLLPHSHYSEIVSACLENVSRLQGAVAGAGRRRLSPALLLQAKEVMARWSALRTAAARRGTARRLRRELVTLRDSLADICEPPEQRPQLHNKQQLCRRIDLLKERLARLLDEKVCLLKLSVTARRALHGLHDETEPPGAGALAADLTALLADWDHHTRRISSELLSLENALRTWSEWEVGLSELTTALRSDRDALNCISDNKGGSSCGSLSDSGISDGDSEAAAAAAEAVRSARARRLAALRDLARDLQSALAPQSHAIRAITKRMEQAESEMRALHESCRALASPAAPHSAAAVAAAAAAGARAREEGGAGRGGRVRWWRVLRSALPFQLCLVAVLVAAWLLERPRCCHLLNTLADSLTPTLRYVRGPPPH